MRAGLRDTVQLYDALAGGSWSSTLVTVSSSGLVTGFASGIGTVTYTASSGCFATMPVTVRPVPAAITGVTRVCVGTATALADATGGGIWGPDNLRTAADAGVSGTVTGIAAGTQVVSYTIPATGCKQTVVVTVSPFPSPVSGTANVCAGAATALGDTVKRRRMEQRCCGRCATIDPASGMVSGLSAGTSLVSYYVGAGLRCIERR